MALELFRRSLSQTLAEASSRSTSAAQEPHEEGVPEVWAIFEDVIKRTNMYSLTARLLCTASVFRPSSRVLIEGNAIQVHPLVCTAFNADFDGDQMAVHVPLFRKAQLEASEIMAAHKNILKPGSGDPIVSGKMLDIVLGCWWMTKGISGEGRRQDVRQSQQRHHRVGFRCRGFPRENQSARDRPGKVQSIRGKVFGTTVGRLLSSTRCFPTITRYINKKWSASQWPRSWMTSSTVTVSPKYRPSWTGSKRSVSSTRLTPVLPWGIDDVKVPPGKAEVIDQAKENRKLPTASGAADFCPG